MCSSRPEWLRVRIPSAKSKSPAISPRSAARFRAPGPSGSSPSSRIASCKAARSRRTGAAIDQIVVDEHERMKNLQARRPDPDRPRSRIARIREDPITRQTKPRAEPLPPQRTNSEIRSKSGRSRGFDAYRRCASPSAVRQAAVDLDPVFRGREPAGDRRCAMRGDLKHGRPHRKRDYVTPRRNTGAGPGKHPRMGCVCRGSFPDLTRIVTGRTGRTLKRTFATGDEAERGDGDGPDSARTAEMARRARSSPGLVGSVRRSRPAADRGNAAVTPVFPWARPGRPDPIIA